MKQQTYRKIMDVKFKENDGENYHPGSLDRFK